MTAIAEHFPEPTLKATAEPYVMAFVGDEATREVLDRIANEEGWPADAVQDGGSEAALHALSVGPAPQLLIVDIERSIDPAADVRALNRRCETGSALIALGTVNDVEVFRDLIAAGAADYLVKPVTTDTLQRAILGAQRPAAAEAAPAAHHAEQPTAPVIAVLGTRGGVGASTVAVNVAWLLAEEGSRRVALVDLDLHFGTCALALDLEPGPGLRDALAHPGRIDGLFIASAMVHANENLAVLGAEEAPDTDFTFEPEGVDLLLAELRRGFDCVIVDVPRAAGPAQQRALTTATKILLVSDLSIAAMRDAIRLLAMTQRLGVSDRVRVVANRVDHGRRTAIRRRDFERGIEMKVAHLLPEDIATAGNSANIGKPVAVVAKRSPLVKALRDVTRTALPQEEETKQRPPLPSWFGRLSLSMSFKKK